MHFHLYQPCITTRNLCAEDRVQLPHFVEVLTVPLTKFVWKMLHWFLILLLTRESVSQCFTNTDCTGVVIVASDEQVCCVETNDGISFNDGSSCNLCIGLSRQGKLRGTIC